MNTQEIARRNIIVRAWICRRDALQARAQGRWDLYDYYRGLRDAFCASSRLIRPIRQAKPVMLKAA